MLKETVEIKVDYEKAGVSSEGCAPVLDCYYNTLTEEIGRKKHKAIIICPGGGYDWCSEREAEPVAFRFLGAGICAFVLRYSCVKKNFLLTLWNVGRLSNMLEIMRRNLTLILTR